LSVVFQRSYYMLIASLPHLPMNFEVERPPIGRERLRERLRMLHEDDDKVIQQVANFLAWDRQPLDRTDEEIIARYDDLMAAISNPLVREVVDTRMDVRTIVTAVRRRRAGAEPPPGVGQWVDHIRRHWQHPTFALEARYPWIAEFDQHLGAGTVLAAQRLLFSTAYRKWGRMAERYTFSFEAVILYLARWEIIDRWTSRNAEAGRQRFDNLITETLGKYVKLY
jgi:hypothetical protein